LEIFSENRFVGVANVAIINPIMVFLGAISLRG
jgi:hypothetical protein